MSQELDPAVIQLYLQRKNLGAKIDRTQTILWALNSGYKTDRSIYQRPEAAAAVSDRLKFWAMARLYQDFIGASRQFLMLMPDRIQSLGIEAISDAYCRFKGVQPVADPNLQMERAAALLGDNPRQVLAHLYHDQHLGSPMIGKIVGVTADMIDKWLKFFDIPAKDQSTATRAIWLNPALKQRMVEKIHTPQSRQKRSAKFWENYPHSYGFQRRSEFGAAMSQLGKERQQKRVADTIGVAPAESLRCWHYDQNLTVPQIVDIINAQLPPAMKPVSKAELHQRLKDFDIKFRPELTRKLTPRPSGNAELVAQARENGMLAELSEVEQLIINCRYPDSGDPLSQQSIGDQIHRTRAAIQLAERKIFLKILKFQAGEISETSPAPTYRKA